MRGFTDVILNRRSIRKFEDKEIPVSAMDAVLDAVQYSPSWANTQCWEIVIIKDLQIKTKLQETIAPKNPATKAIVSAPIVLGIVGKLNSSGFYDNKATTKFNDWFMFDLGIATQSICLAAENQDLGTVIVGLFDHDKAKKVLEIPDGYELVSLIPMGYPAKRPNAPKRREKTDFVHYETF